MTANVVPYCVSCGAAPLWSYRGRRVAAGPLCGRCIRERILRDPVRPPRWDDVLAGDEMRERSEGVVIDLRPVGPYLVPDLRDPDELDAAVESRTTIDLDELASSEDMAVNDGSDGELDVTEHLARAVAPNGRRRRPLRAQG